MKNKIFNWLILFIWMFLMYYLSSQSNLASGFNYYIDFILRKAGHFAEYFILALFAFNAVVRYRLGVKRSLFFSLIIAIAYAVTDEYHQSFVAGRVSSPIDVMIDSFGSIIFITVQYFLKLVKFN